jgi:tRNA A-37 threonylcarbamoyl transferase component Bud32/TolB-like protein
MIRFPFRLTPERPPNEFHAATHPEFLPVPSDMQEGTGFLLERPVKEGTTLSHYRILSRLGEGGMGTVYRAEDIRLGRVVALKLLRREIASDADKGRRFRQEARAASAVSHPGIATLFDFHQEGQTAFLTMEFVEGRSLREILKKGRLSFEQLQDCALQMADALAEAHRKGIVHRDLKPENVMRSDSGFYKILDFGLAKVVQESGPVAADATRADTLTGQMTKEGFLLGTAAYMSPEQAQGDAVDARSDLFSFGALLYEMATGLSPFRRNNAIATFHAVVYEDPDPVRSLRPDLPEGFERIVTTCLAKDPGERYAGAEALLADLVALSGHTPSGVWRRLHPGRRSAASGRWLAWTAGAAALVAAAALIALFVRGGEAERGPMTPQQTPSPAGQVLPAASGKHHIAVAPFANNSGSAEIDWLRRGLPEMLTTELARGGDLHIISTQRLYDLMSAAGREGEGDLDGATATDLARWAGAGIVVSGSIFRTADSYRFDVQAYDTASGEILAATKVEGAEIFPMVDRLTMDLRRQLHLATGSKGGIRTVTTASESAFRYFTEGIDLFNDLRFADSSESFRQSIEADPDFSQAKMRLGMSLYLDGSPEQGLEWLQQAAAEADRMPDHDRHLIRIVQAFYHDRDPEGARSHLEAMGRDFPRDPEGKFWQAQALSDIESDPVRAIRVLQDVIQIDPNYLPAVSELSLRMDSLGLSAGAEAIISEYLGRNPEAAGPLNDLLGQLRAGAGSESPVPPVSP